MIMAGFSQANALPTTFLEHVRKLLFDAPHEYEYHSFEVYSDGYPDWREESNLGKVNSPKTNSGWRWLQCGKTVEGQLLGGNIEVLEFMKGTVYWPRKDFWNAKILFLETSEEKPSLIQVKRWLRNYGTQGIFDEISALLIGRARDYSEEESKKLDETLLTVISKEFGNADLPIVTNMDFGHTDPQFILPIGVRATVDSRKRVFKLNESPVL
jgi:muramoyltetrapeptide carboxypeptidase LdcA involved in peptidoglycan recycling